MSLQIPPSTPRKRPSTEDLDNEKERRKRKPENDDDDCRTALLRIKGDRPSRPNDVHKGIRMHRRGWCCKCEVDSKIKGAKEGGSCVLCGHERCLECLFVSRVKRESSDAEK